MSRKGGAPCFVHGIGTAVPEQSLSAARSPQLMAQTCLSPRSAKLLQKIAPLTGIEKRHLAALDYMEEGGAATPLYRPAQEQPTGPGMGARNALFERASAPLVLRALSAFSREQLCGIGTLVTASCTHASSPGLERPILTHTPVPLSAHRWNLGFMGCSAGLAAVRLVHQSASAKPSLVVVCELSSLHFQYTEQLDQLTANLLFADGAAAVLLASEPSAVQVVDCACAAMPESADQMVWFAGDHGLQLRLSQDLPDTLSAVLGGVVTDFLRDNETSIQEVSHWIVHPGGPQILDTVERSLGLPPDALQLSRSILQQYGNMSSPTVFFILKELLAFKASGSAVAIAFGPGLTIELVLLQLGEAGDHKRR